MICQNPQSVREFFRIHQGLSSLRRNKFAEIENQGGDTNLRVVGIKPGIKPYILSCP